MENIAVNQDREYKWVEVTLHPEWNNFLQDRQQTELSLATTAGLTSTMTSASTFQMFHGVFKMLFVKSKKS